jgi:DNA invertase Pin-like site-specific DNA recombinase
MSVLHKCDVRNCVNPDHLFIGTQLDNMRDCKAKGRIKSPVPRFAEKNPISKINRVIVYEMKKIRSETGMSYKKIAKMFNISTMTAYRAVKEISWK